MSAASEKRKLIIGDPNVLPTRGSQTREALASPIAWGPELFGNEDLREATLPERWRKVHLHPQAAWVWILDEQGRPRAYATINGAGYPSFSLEPRFQLAVLGSSTSPERELHRVGDRGVPDPTDYAMGKTIWSREYPSLSASSAAHTKTNRDRSKALLDRAFPSHRDANAYWELGPTDGETVMIAYASHRMFAP